MIPGIIPFYQSSMKKLSSLLVLLIFGGWAAAQTKSPAEFLGYELGQRFTPHHQIVSYFEHVAEKNSNVKIQYYGTTNELRPLLVAFISSEENIENIETLRQDNLRRTGLMSGNITTKIPITWLSYNVHGNEAVSSEATMLTLWSLVNPENSDTKSWMENNLVVMDPCINPDGRDRYVMWYNQKMNSRLQPDPQSIEHNEPWPGGRANHYLFDLNRDWAWQTQKESQQRLKIYQQWMPQLHLDFHEQGINSPYYFAPAAEPMHHQLSPFQHEFQQTFGRNTAKYFDQNDWFYFTKEIFDLLYPSYGDTYPLYNGAIGMTIEQGGSGRAGIGVLTAEGDTLTLKDRILHHHTTGLSAIEVTSKNAEEVVDQFEKYFKDNSTDPKGKYKSFVIKGSNPPARITALLNLLDKNAIQYGFASNEKNRRGLNYRTGKAESFAINEQDIVINAYQPKSVLTQILFEPEPVLNDSITYDITSWALPYVYGLEAYASEERINSAKEYAQTAFEPNRADPGTLAYIAPWNATIHASFLAALLNDKIRVRYATYAFQIGEDSYPAGSLIITRGGNQYINNFHEKVVTLANEMEITLGQTSTGYVDDGKDFGSSSVKTIIAPKVALIGGENTSSLNFGEIWHFFEQELDYPLSILDQAQIANADLSQYNMIILPSGKYDGWKEGKNDKLQDWIKSGGKVLAIDAALSFFADKEDFGLSEFRDEEEKKASEKSKMDTSYHERSAPFQERERRDISNYAAGAIFEVQMDTTHALGFGTGGKYYVLKNNAQRYAYLKEGVNAGIIPSVENHRTGFIGYKAKEKVKESLAFGVEPYGKGQIIYMADNPIIRSFWENGKLIMANALFMVQ